MASTYDVGTRAWQPDAAEGWVASELVSKNIEGAKAKLVFKLENGEVRHTIDPSKCCITRRLTRSLYTDQDHRSTYRLA